MIYGTFFGMGGRKIVRWKKQNKASYKNHVFGEILVVVLNSESLDSFSVFSKLHLDGS